MMHQSPARGFPSPSLNTKGSRSERSEEREGPPQADRSSTPVRIAKRDGDAGETVERADGKAPGNPKNTGRQQWSRRESNRHEPGQSDSVIVVLPQCA
jgi:hypothetical protein